MNNIETPEELKLKGRWAMAEPVFTEVLRVIQEINPSRIVEFGSGISSIRLAMAFPEAEIISIEGNKKFHREVIALKAKHAASSRLDLIFSPLQFMRYGMSFFLSYRPIRFKDPIDCVIVDGPPTKYTVRGREACLYQIYDVLRARGVVIIDDYRRSSEKSVVRNWQLTYPDSFELEEIPVGRHLAILRKKASVRPRWIVFKKTADNWLSNLTFPFYTLLYHSYLFFYLFSERLRKSQ